MKKRAQKDGKKFPIWAIIAIFVAIGLIVATVVFIVMMKVAEAEGYRKAKEDTDEILGTREAVVAYLSAENEGEKLSDENKEKFENFEKAVDELSEKMNKLGESRVVHDESIRVKYDEATDQLGNLQYVSETEQMLADAMEDGALSDEEIEQISNSESEYLKKMAEDFKEYRTKVKEFNEKYADLKGKDKAQLDADYAKIQQDGNELKKKYEKIEFDDVYGMSRDDILKFYATIEELNKILTEKI